MISLVPLLGYAVLWSNDLEPVLMRFDILGSLWFTPAQRINLLYFGAVTVLAGLLLYWLACPRYVRQHATCSTFLNNYFAETDPTSLKELYLMLQPSISRGGAAARREFGSIVDNGGLLVIRRVLEKISDDARRAEALTSEATIRELRFLMTAIWNYALMQAPRSAMTSTALLLFGAMLFLLPALEVFAMATRQLLGTFS